MQYALVLLLGLIGALSPIYSSQSFASEDSKIAGVLVRYRNAESVQSAGRALSLHHNIMRLEADADEVDDLVDALNQDPNVEYAEPNYAIQLERQPEDPFYAPPYDRIYTFYNYHISNVVDAWDEASNCDKFIIAVIDSGIERDHPDIEDNLYINAGEIPDNGIDDDGNGYVDDWSGYNFYDGNSDVSDAQDHGTKVAGIIGAVGNNDKGMSGICWSAQILPLKVMANFGQGNVHAAIEAIDYAIDQGARVLNLSWTIQGGHLSQFLKEAIKKAGNRGVVVVAAAGNQQQNIDDYPVYPASYKLSNLIAVAAHDPDGELLDNSNFGEETVDIAAPGIGILTTNNNSYYSRFSGTSAAAPHVSATIALLLNLQPQLSAETLVALLVDYSTVDEALSGLVFGSGRLNVLSAVSAAGETDPGNEETKNSFVYSLYSNQSSCSLVGHENAGMPPYVLLFGLNIAIVALMRRNEKR